MVTFVMLKWYEHLHDKENPAIYWMALVYFIAVDFLFYVPPPCLWGFCVEICFGMHYFAFFQVLQSIFFWHQIHREYWSLVFFISILPVKALRTLVDMRSQS